MYLYFAENLAYLRKQKGFSQAEFSEKIGMSRAITSLYETGKREPTLSNLVEMAQILEVSIDDLLTKDMRPAGLQLSNNLKYLRKSNNYTQADMAQILKIGRSTLIGYELGEKRPSYEGLLNLAEFFGVTVDDLLKKDLSKEG